MLRLGLIQEKWFGRGHDIGNSSVITLMKFSLSQMYLCFPLFQMLHFALYPFLFNSPPPLPLTFGSTLHFQNY